MAIFGYTSKNLEDNLSVGVVVADSLEEAIEFLEGEDEYYGKRTHIKEISLEKGLHYLGEYVVLD
jgi:prefoldin subunit 5